MMSRKTNTMERAHQLWLEELQDAFEVFENAANGDLLFKDLGAA